MKTIHLIMIPALAAMMLSSCVKDELYNTPHPDTGAVNVTADWRAISSEASIPDTYYIVVADMKQAATGVTNTLDRTLPPGQYEILLHNTPSGMTVVGDNATVNATRADGSIEAMPDYLFAGSRNDLMIRPDASTDITVAMNQYVRRLNIELSVIEGDHTRIASVTGTLSGAESQINIRNGRRAEVPATVSGVFAQSGPTMTLSYNLLGLVHSSGSKLLTTLTFTDGHVQTIESDLASLLPDFHDDTEPVTLNASLSVPVRSGMSATITDWHKADGGNVDAH